MKEYKEWLNEELSFLWTMVWTWKINDDYILIRIERIEWALKLINEFEDEWIKWE